MIPFNSNPDCTRPHGPECVSVEIVGGREVHYTADRDVWASYPAPDGGKEPTAGEVDRVVANLRAARQPVYDPTDPVQVAAVEQLRSATTDQPQGCRTLCGRCGEPIEYVTDPTGDYWRHLEIPDPPHPATPTPTYGEGE